MDTSNNIFIALSLLILVALVLEMEEYVKKKVDKEQEQVTIWNCLRKPLDMYHKKKNIYLYD